MYIARVLILLSVFVPGCIGGQKAHEYVRDGRKSVDDVSRAILAAARARPDSDQAVLDSYEDEIKGRIAAQDAAMNDIKRQMEEQQKVWKDFVLVVAQAAGSTIPGGGPIVSNFMAALGKTREDAASYTDKVNTETENKIEGRVTQEQLEALKGLSAEELMAMLLAAGGATAAGGALGKTGRSRAQPQIDAINARLGNSGNRTG